MKYVRKCFLIMIVRGGIKIKNFFRRKSKEKLSYYEKKKQEVLTKIYMNFEKFNFDYTYLSPGLEGAIFADEKNRKVGVFKASMKLKGKNYEFLIDEENILIPFKKLEAIGIELKEEELFLESSADMEWFNKDQELESIINKLETLPTPKVTDISIFVRERGELYQSDNIYLNYNFTELNELKQFLILFSEYMLDGQKEFFEDQKKDETEELLGKIENNLNYLERSATIIEDYLITDLLISWDFIIDEISDATNYEYNIDSLEIEAIRQNKLFLTCSEKDLININIPVINKILSFVFKQKGFDQISIIPKGFGVVKVYLENDILICRKIFDEILNLNIGTDLKEEFPSLNTAKVRKFQDGKLFINYDKDDLDELNKSWKLYHRLYDEILSKVFFILTGNTKLEIIFIKSSEPVE